MKLNVYDKKGKIEKTYEKEAADLMFGTIDDVSRALDLKSGEKIAVSDLTPLVTEFIDSDIDKAKEIMKDIFDGLTDEEIRRVKMSEFVTAIVEVIGYTIGMLGKGKEDDEKN